MGKKNVRSDKMPTEKKIKTVETLQAIFAQSESGIFTDYRGLKTSEVVAVRRKLKDTKAEYKVVKNTLARIAAKNTGKDKLPEGLNGPMAIAFVHDDISRTAKVLTEHIATAKIAMKIKGGFLGNKLLTPKEVATLASLPTKEVLLSRVIGGFQSPLYAFMGQLNAPLRGLLTILQARAKQLEGV
jgi:large subunit ribosomal protein L10